MAGVLAHDQPQVPLGRYDLADDKLLQEAFSDKPAEPGTPRLRIPGGPDKSG